jgi:hypothetical protein
MHALMHARARVRREAGLPPAAQGTRATAGGGTLQNPGFA